MADILQVLPAELVARVFSFLHDRRDVARSRLVCRTFRELSSPFLITQVVFALRLDTIARLRDVVHHPYFSKHVDTLVYDASRYRTQLAVDWLSYTSDCLDAPRTIVDESWTQRTQQDSDIISSLAHLSLGDGVLDHQPQPDPHSQHVNREEMLYQMGCQKSFPEYYLRCKNQEALKAKKTPRRLLRELFTHLPKLRNIVFTDYRSLAKPAESYDAMCKRLFGLVLEPTHLSTDSASIDDLGLLLDVSGNARITSFSIGPHPFVSTDTILKGHTTSVQWPGVFKPKWLSDTLNRKVFANLRELDLSYEHDPHYHDAVRRLLEATPDLERLSLTVLKDRRYAERDNIWAVTEQPLTVGFFDTQLPRLKYLELRHLQLPDTQALQGYLQRHASTIRELRLIECCMTDRAGEQDKLAEWAGQKMVLTGVEVLTAGDLSLLSNINSWYTQKSDLDELSERVIRDGWERIDLREAKYLNGRPNTLRRTVDIADRSIPVEQWKKEWWLRPCRM